MSDRALACEKCGGSAILTRYHSGSSYWGTHARCAYGREAHRNVASSEDEHLHFTCQTCRYDWTGAVLTEDEPSLCERIGHDDLVLFSTVSVAGADLQCLRCSRVKRVSEPDAP